MLGEEPAVAVLYINRPVAGLEIVATSPVPVKVMRGGRNPFEVDATSSCADAAGVLVPIPTVPFNIELPDPLGVSVTF